MAGKDLFTSDISTRQQDILNQIIRQEKQTGSAVSAVSVQDAKAGESLYQVTTTRDAVRLLFISRDTTLLNQTQQSLDGYLQLSEVFDEVHIVILRPGITPKHPVLRVAPNVWIYIASAKYWWQTPFAALRLIEEELVFADGFRPDLIVARDPFECAVVASVAGRLHDRPTQLHITEDFTSRSFRRDTKVARERAWLARRIIPYFSSIRTTTDQMRDKIRTMFPAVPDLDTLPRYAAYEELATYVPTVDLKRKYQQFSFMYLYVGPLHATSSVLVVLDSLRGVLANPHVGLLIVGNGTLREELRTTATNYGIGNQVVFEQSPQDLISYLKTADTLIVTDTDAVSDEIVLRGIASGVPVICTPTPLRTDLLVHEQSAFFTDYSGLTLRQFASRLLNDFSERKRLQAAAAAVVVTRLHSDPEQYRSEYRASVEQGLWAGMETVSSDTPVPAPVPA